MVKSGLNYGRSATHLEQFVRPAVNKDFFIFYGQRPPKMTIAVVVHNKKNQPLAIGGVMLCGSYWLGFADMTKWVSKRSIAKGIRLMRKIMANTNLPIYATRDKSESTSKSFLSHLGFKNMEI